MRRTVLLTLLSISSFSALSATTCGDLVTAIYENDPSKAGQLFLQSTADIENEAVGQRYFTKIYTMSSASLDSAMAAVVKQCMAKNPDVLVADIVTDVL